MAENATPVLAGNAKAHSTSGEVTTLSPLAGGIVTRMGHFEEDIGRVDREAEAIRQT